MSSDAPQAWEVWHARFDFDGGKGYKYRPVIVIGSNGDGSAVIMVTSSTNQLHMEHDYLLIDWEAASLAKPSIARIDRIATIPASYLGTSGMLGRLAEIDADAIKQTQSKIDEEEARHNPEP